MNIVAVTLALEIALHGPPTEDARPCSGALMRVNDSFPSFVRPRVHNVDVKDVNTIWLKGSLIAWLYLGDDSHLYIEANSNTVAGTALARSRLHLADPSGAYYTIIPYLGRKTLPVGAEIIQCFSAGALLS